MRHPSDAIRPVKKSYHGRYHTPRTRSGCLACRKRKLKCDERKPSCLRCKSSDKCCQYGLKLTWKTEAAEQSAGFTSRPATSKLKPDATRNPENDVSPKFSCPVALSSRSSRFVAFLNTSQEEIFLVCSEATVVIKSQPLDCNNSEDGSEALRVISSKKHNSPSPIESNLSLRHPNLELSATASTLLDFYINRMCSTCSLLDGHDNGYKHVILPISINSPLVMKSVLAVAANHIRFLDPTYNITALRYRGTALRSLRQMLNTPNLISKSELLSTILMLCFFDISDGCQSDWSKHLKGATRVMMQQFATEDGHLNNTVLTFLAQYFASHNIMAYTALAESSQEKVLKSGGEFWLSQINRPRKEIDSIVGCSKELMTIIFDISCLFRDAHELRSSGSLDLKTDRLAWKRATETKLKDLQQHVSHVSDATSASVTRLQHTAAAFKEAAIILLQYLDPEHQSTSDTKTRECVTNVLALLSQCPIDPNGARSSSLWPFFIAACHVESDEERIFVLKRFHSMESRKRFGNIAPVREVVECVWKRRDLQVYGMERSSGVSNGRFEWEVSMEFLGSNLSLT